MTTTRGPIEVLGLVSAALAWASCFQTQEHGGKAEWGPGLATLLRNDPQGPAELCLGESQRTWAAGNPAVSPGRSPGSRRAGCWGCWASMCDAPAHKHFLPCQPTGLPSPGSCQAPAVGRKAPGERGQLGFPEGVHADAQSPPGLRLTARQYILSCPDPCPISVGKTSGTGAGDSGAICPRA